jgi:hypothetical protein
MTGRNRRGEEIRIKDEINNKTTKNVRIEMQNGQN